MCAIEENKVSKQLSICVPCCALFGSILGRTFTGDLLTQGRQPYILLRTLCRWRYNRLLAALEPRPEREELAKGWGLQASFLVKTTPGAQLGGGASCVASEVSSELCEFLYETIL